MSMFEAEVLGVGCWCVPGMSGAREYRWRLLSGGAVARGGTVRPVAEVGLGLLMGLGVALRWC